MHALQSFQFIDAMGSFLHVNGSKSAIRCILRSVSKPTLSFLVCLKSEKLIISYRPEILEYRDEQTVKASLLFLKFSVSQFIQSQNY